MAHRTAGTLLLFATIGLFLQAHTGDSGGITWSREVVRIVNRNCISCHHNGGLSVPLATYQEARIFTQAIKQQVLSRSMPPWNAVEGFGEFKDERGLSQEDIEIIAEWVEEGAPEGNPAFLPSKSEVLSESKGSIPDIKGVTISGTQLLKYSIEVIGIRPERLPMSGVLQAVAQKPDGTIAPLLWINRFNSKYNETYYLRQPLYLPRGTRVNVVPETGEVLFVIKKPSPR
jgi:hypothetical protein